MAKRTVKSEKATRKKTAAKKPIESYDHKDKKRANNPPVGLVTPDTDPDHGKKKKYEYDPHLDPQLVWAGKAEHTSFEVPTVSLHVHERIDPRTIIEAVRKRNSNGGNGQMMLFEQQEQNLPLREAIEFYKHAKGWTNRLIAGGSLLVMNSLLEKEGMAGKVQMVYIDPPYGIRYGSNFQPFVNKRDVKDGKDEDLTQEPEMIRAFRDTWELGIHSYLTYLRDRLLLARELLHESGSCFVQIGDENLSLARGLLDEVFGADNFEALITFRKTNITFATGRLGGVCDYILWYARDREKKKYRQLFIDKEIGGEGASNYGFVEAPDGTRRRLSGAEKHSAKALPADGRVFATENLMSSGATESCIYDFDLDGKVYEPVRGKSWKTHMDGLAKLACCNRLMPLGDDRLYFITYFDEYPITKLTNAWYDTRGEMDLSYIVQTAPTPLQRCMLMTTDPGDLVLDPTCGSGTTAYVAEQWGRRWITCDTSRVSIALAKQRLMTPVFDYYELAHPDEGVGSGFKYKTVPHITLGAIANNPEINEGMSRKAIDAAIAKYADQETLYDQPKVDKSKARVSGPFTVEAVPAPAVRSIAEVTAERPSYPSRDCEEADGVANAGEEPLPHGRGSVIADASVADSSVGRSGETLRQDEWRDELLKCGIRGKKKQHIHFSRVETLAGTRWLHADAETKPSPQPSPSKGEGAFEPERVVVSFGPEHAPLEQRQVAAALEEAQLLVPKPKMVVFASFQFDPEAAKDIDETNWPGITLLKVQMNTDLLTDDLKKKRSSNESFWMIGQPDVEVRRSDGGTEGDRKGSTKRRSDGATEGKRNTSLR